MQRKLDNGTGSSPQLALTKEKLPGIGKVPVRLSNASQQQKHKGHSPAQMGALGGGEIRHMCRKNNFFVTLRSVVLINKQDTWCLVANGLRRSVSAHHV